MNDLNEIAATIMAGLLASSDYTESGDMYIGKHKGKTRYREEIVDDAVALARALIEKTKGLVAAPPQSPPQPSDAS